MKNNSLIVKLFGQIVGYMVMDRNTVVFQYEDEFKKSGLEISPIKLPLETTLTYTNTEDIFFEGLAGVFHDSLPDRFGNKIITEYYAKKGIEQSQLNVIQKLAYIGSNGMGALEYEPEEKGDKIKEALEIRSLVDDARKVITGQMEDAIPDIMESGGSAGGARAKAIIQWNKQTNDIRSGRAKIQKGYENYIIKFDGVGEDKRPADYTKVEYLYMLAAKELNLITADVELLQDRDYAHLLVKRFDRNNTDKVHMHSLCGMTHTNFNLPGIYSYEEYFKVVDYVCKDKNTTTMAFLHMLFNIITRNQDDHTKNFSFLMDQQGNWNTSPLYDITYNYGNDYTARHQMTINGKQDNFTMQDILEVNKKFDFDKEEKNIKAIIEYYSEFFKDFVSSKGKELGIANEKVERIIKNIRTL